MTAGDAEHQLQHPTANRHDRRDHPTENSIVGAWHDIGGKMEPDMATSRIHSLLAADLTKLVSSSSGWSALYQDPDDQRLWELTYPTAIGREEGHLVWM